MTTVYSDGRYIPTLIAPKAPLAKKSYGFDWTAWVGGDTIATSSWDVPAGLTEEFNNNSDTHTNIMLSGGVQGEIYLLTNTITTATSGEIEPRSFYLKIEQT